MLRMIIVKASDSCAQITDYALLHMWSQGELTIMNKFNERQNQGTFVMSSTNVNLLKKSHEPRPL